MENGRGKERVRDCLLGAAQLKLVLGERCEELRDTCKAVEPEPKELEPQ